MSIFARKRHVEPVDVTPAREPATEAPVRTSYCSFCGKSEHDVAKLIAGPTVLICNECVDLCNDIIREEHLPTKETAMSPQDQELRLECLKLAARDRVCGAEAVANAERYYVFLTTKSQTPRQTIDAALDKAGVA